MPSPAPITVEHTATRAMRLRARRVAHMRRTYGISKIEWETLLAAQGEKCAVCSVPFEGVNPCVDHDHETGEVRGLLCGTCNTGLGMFRDDPELLKRAAEYLDA